MVARYFVSAPVLFALGISVCWVLLPCALVAGALLNQGRARLLDGRTLRLFGYRRGGRSTVTSELLHLAFMYTKDRWTTGLLCTYILQNGGGGDDLSNVIIIIIITWKVNLQCPRNGVVDWQKCKLSLCKCSSHSACGQTLDRITLTGK